MSVALTLEDFLRRAREFEVRDLQLIVTARIDLSGFVHTFDYALSAPSSNPLGESQHPGVRALKDHMGHPPGAWFADGYRLPTHDDNVLDSFRRFTSSNTEEITAFARVADFVALRSVLQDSDFCVTMWGRNIEVLLDWAQLTYRAAYEPKIKRMAEENWRR